MRLTILTLLFTLLACTATAHAQRAAQGLQQAQQAPSPATQGAAPGPAGPASTAPRPTPEGAIEIRTLVDQVARDLDKEIIIDPRVAGLWGVTTSADVDYDTLLGILRVNNLVAIETADQILIVPDANARSMPTRLLQEDDARVSDHEIVTRIIQLPENYTSDDDGETIPGAVFLVPVLRPMMPQSAQLAAIPMTNTLVLVDHYDNIRRLTAVIREIVDGARR